MIKITETLFSFPPFLLTTWDMVDFLEGVAFDEELVTLVFHMLKGIRISLPPLSKETVEAIFQAFLSYQENRQAVKQRLKKALCQILLQPTPLPPELPSSPSLHSFFLEAANFANSSLSFSPALSFSPDLQALRHNPELKNLQQLPQEFLTKIAETARNWFTNNPSLELPLAESGCRCLHCQIARAIYVGAEHAGAEIKQEELLFSAWRVEPLGNDTFLVTDSQEPKELFHVVLKPKIVCSCAVPGCEHIEAVLRT